MSFIRNRVYARAFLRSYKNTFAGQAMNPSTLYPVSFPTVTSSIWKKEFVTSTICDRDQKGSLLFWGLVGQVNPPHLVTPITMKSTKPLCAIMRGSSTFESTICFSFKIYTSNLFTTKKIHALGNLSVLAVIHLAVSPPVSVAVFNLVRSF